jgi:hypothetical protein
MIDYAIKGNIIELYWDNDVVTYTKEEAIEVADILERFYTSRDVVVTSTDPYLIRSKEFEEKIRKQLEEELTNMTSSISFKMPHQAH